MLKKYLITFFQRSLIKRIKQNFNQSLRLSLLTIKKNSTLTTCSKSIFKKKSKIRDTNIIT